METCDSDRLYKMKYKAPEAQEIMPNQTEKTGKISLLKSQSHCIIIQNYHNVKTLTFSLTTR